MVFRAPTILFRDRLLAPLQAALETDRDATRPVASGKRVIVPSDDPLDYIRARGLEAEIESSRQFVENAQDAMRLLETADSKVSDLTDRLQRARTLVLQGASDSYTTADRALLGNEIDTILEDIVFIANARADGVALFGGAETDEDPFRVVRDAQGRVTDVVYRGDRVESRRRIGVGETDTEAVTFIGSLIFQVAPDDLRSGFTVANPNLPLAGLLPAGPTSVAISVNDRRITLDLSVDSLNDVAQKINDSIAGVTASVVDAGGGTFALRLVTDVPDQLFLKDLADGAFLFRMQLIDGVSPPTGNDHANAVANDLSLFRLLAEIRDDLQAGEGEDVLRRHLADLETALDSNVGIRATIGARQRRVELAQVREEGLQVEFKRFLSEAEDVDFAEATTELVRARTKLQAAAEAAKGVAPLTLANFI